MFLHQDLNWISQNLGAGGGEGRGLLRQRRQEMLLKLIYILHDLHENDTYLA